MSKFGVSEDKEKALFKLMKELGILEENLTEKFILGSGSGGQKVNKTASCVYIRDSKSKLEVKCQKTRSQKLNRYYARKLLCEKLDTIIKGKKSKKKQEFEKIKRQKRKRSRRAKNKMLDDKKKRQGVKNLRKTVRED